MKKYNVAEVAFKYVFSFFNFVKSNIEERDTNKLYPLFYYGVKSLYGFERIEYNEVIEEYGQKFIKELYSVKGTPSKREIDSFSFENRVQVLSACCETMRVLIYSARIGGMLDEVKI